MVGLLAELVQVLGCLPCGVLRYGSGNGSTTFNKPDLRGRMIVGRRNADSLGDEDGDRTVTLTTAQMPQHRHNGPNHTHTTPNHTHDIAGHSHSISGTLAIASAVTSHSLSSQRFYIVTTDTRYASSVDVGAGSAWGGT